MSSPEFSDTDIGTTAMLQPYTVSAADEHVAPVIVQELRKMCDKANRGDMEAALRIAMMIRRCNGITTQTVLDVFPDLEEGGDVTDPLPMPSNVPYVHKWWQEDRENEDPRRWRPRN